MLRLLPKQRFIVAIARTQAISSTHGMESIYIVGTAPTRATSYTHGMDVIYIEVTVHTHQISLPHGMGDSSTKERAIIQATRYIPLMANIFIKGEATTRRTRWRHGATIAYMRDIVYIQPTLCIA